jgi:ribosomal protein S18 acetylase RimI-like enzyme
MTAELDRAFAFEDALHDAAVDRSEPIPIGRALFTDSLPVVWSLNFLRIDQIGVTAEEIATEAQRLQGGAGLEHRRVIVEDENAGRGLEAGFVALGWKPDVFLFMVPRREPNRSIDTADVVEVSREELRPIREAILNEWLGKVDEDLMAQLAKSERRFAAAGNARHFAVVVDGKPVSSTDLFTDGRTAQIEDVGTLPEHRGAGHASAVVMKALVEARAMGHDFVFLVADARDWPKEMYRRLGFDPIGERYAFLLSENAP